MALLLLVLLVTHLEFCSHVLLPAPLGPTMARRAPG